MVRSSNWGESGENSDFVDFGWYSVAARASCTMRSTTACVLAASSLHSWMPGRWRTKNCSVVLSTGSKQHAFCKNGTPPSVCGRSSSCVLNLLTTSCTSCCMPREKYMTLARSTPSCSVCSDLPRRKFSSSCSMNCGDTWFVVGLTTPLRGGRNVDMRRMSSSTGTSSSTRSFRYSRFSAIKSPISPCVTAYLFTYILIRSAIVPSFRSFMALHGSTDLLFSWCAMQAT